MKISKFLSNPWLLAAIALTAAHQAHGQSNWIYTGTTSTSLFWSNVPSWSSQGVPNAIGATAIFDANITGTKLIQLNGDRTLGTLAIDDKTGTDLQPFSKYDFTGGTFIFDAESGSANLNSIMPGNTATSSIFVPITLNDPLSINWNKDNPAAIVLYGSITDGSFSHAISKSGNGIATFKVANTYDGGTTISAGRIGAENVGSFGTGGVAVTSGGQAFLNSSGTFTNAFSLAGDGYAMPADAGALVGALRYSHNTTTSNTITLTGDARVGAAGATTVGTMGGPLSGNFNLQINSTASTHNGTIVLNGDASAMMGTITVKNGGLGLGSASNPGGSVLVDDFAKLSGETHISGDLELGFPGSTFTGATLNFDPSTAAALTVGGNLTLHGTTTVVLDSKPFVGGTLPILSCTGVLTGDLSNLALSAGNYRPGTGLVLDSGLKLISLAVASNALVWTGASSSIWSFDAENWTDGVNPSTFYDLDGVTFDIAGSVTIPNGVKVRPASATFDIPAGGGFQLAGPGTLNNAPIIKRGTGTLTIGNPATYTSTASLVTGSSTVLVEKGNLAFSSLTAVPIDTPITLGSANSGSDPTVLEIPRASADFQTVLEPAITLGALGPGDSSEAILRYTGISAGSNTTGGAPLIQGPINLNGRSLYLENSSHLSGGTTRLVNCNSVISGTGDVHVRTAANPNGSYNVDARFRLSPGAINGDSSVNFLTVNTWVGNLFIDTGYLQLENEVSVDLNNTIPDIALVTMAAGTGIGLANAGETIRGLVGGAATESIPFPAVFEGRRQGASGLRVLTLSDDSGANTHVFDGNVNSGNVNLGLAKNGAATQVLKGNNNYAGPTTVNGGTLEIGGAGTLGQSRSPGSFTYEGNITVAAGATFIYNSTGNQIIGYLSNGALGGAGSLVKDNTGILTLIQANPFTGVITLTGGSLSVATIGNGGVSSNLGAASSAPGNIVFNGGTLLYTGVTAPSNRGFTINDAKTAVIDTPAATNNLSLAGATGAATTGSLTKTGLATLTLTGASTYTGQTLVSAGQLTVAGAGTLAGTSDLSVSGAAAFSYQPTTIGTQLTLGAASALSLADGSTVRLAWDATTANRINATGVASVGTSAGVLIDMGSGTFTSGKSYTILTAASGLNTGSYRFSNLSNFTVAVVKTPISVSITPTTATTLGGAYWRGTATPGLTKSWAATDGSSDSNWASSAGGAIQALVPGADADVFIPPSPLVAATSTVLGANMTIKSLTIADTTNGLSIDADTNTLTLTPGVATNGIVMNASVPASSIAANVAFGASQTWTNNSSDALTVSGNISGPFGLTKDGSGPVILTGVNTYGGATVVTAGTLQIAGSGSLNSGGAISLSSGASLRYSSSSAQVLSGAITGLGALVKDTSSSTLTLLNAANSFSGGITISAGKVSVATAATLSTGPITCVGDSSDGGQLHFTSTVATTIPNNFSISGVGFPDAGANPGRAGAIRAANNQTYSGPITLTGDARFGVIAGVVTNTLSGKITGNFAMDFYGGLTADATQTFILSSPSLSNDYSGNTSITSVDAGAARTGGAVLQLGASEQIPHGVGKGILVFNGADNTNQTILDLNGFNETLNGISNTTDLGTIRNNAVPPLGAPSSLLTIGAADTSSNFAGSLVDASSTAKLELIKIGSGTLTLTGTNTSRGNITVSGGKLSAVRLGASSNSSRAITVASGAVLEFGTGNVFGTGSLATIHRTTAVPPITVNGGTITNAELLVPGQPLLIKVNNALYNVTLNAATLTATVGNGNSPDIRPGEGYGAWGLNGTVTSTGNSLIDTSGVPGKAGHVLLSSSTVDTTFNVVDGALTVASILQRGDSAAGNRGLIKSGAGVLALTAANIYTGNTTVNAGTLALADNAQLKFVLGATSGSNNALTGAGTVTLDGDFVIDTLAADALASGTWTLENVTTLGGAYGSTFRVVDFVDAGGNKWTKANGATTYTFDETTGVLTLGIDFSSWIAGTFVNGTVPLDQRGPDDDPDHDGVNNLLEFAIAGQDPTVGNPTIGTFTGGTLSFTKRAGASGLTYAIQDSTDLGLADVWAEVSGGSYVNNATTISYTLTPGTPPRNFLRLQVTRN